MNKYLIRLWLITLLLAPFIHSVLESITNGGVKVGLLLESYGITFLFSVVFSLPTFFVIYLTNQFVLKQRLPIRIRRTIHVLIAAVGLTCTLFMIEGSLPPTLITTYAISLITAAIVLEIYNHIRGVDSKGEVDDLIDKIGKE